MKRVAWYIPSSISWSSRCPTKPSSRVRTNGHHFVLRAMSDTACCCCTARSKGYSGDRRGADHGGVQIAARELRSTSGPTSRSATITCSIRWTSAPGTRSARIRQPEFLGRPQARARAGVGQGAEQDEPWCWRKGMAAGRSRDRQSGSQSNRLGAPCSRSGPIEAAGLSAPALDAQMQSESTRSPVGSKGRLCGSRSQRAPPHRA